MNKSAKSPSEPAWGADGFVLDSMDATLRARAPEGVWVELVEAARLRAGAERSGREERPAYEARFSALPTDAGALPLYITGELRRATAAGAPVESGLEEALLHLHWELMPEDTPPPASIQRSSDGVGGWPAVLQRVAERWPGPKQVSIEVSATFLVNMEVHRPRPKLGFKSKPVSADEHALTQTAAAWRVEPPCGPVRELSLAVVDAGKLVVVASGTLATRLGSELGSTLKGALWNGVQRLLLTS